MIFGAGSRVQKYRHLLADIYHFSPQEYALLCVLLLRGPQTAGELRGRAERMASFPTLTDAENVLDAMAEGGEPLVRLLGARPGQKERRYVQLLSGEPAEAADEPPPARSEPAGPTRLEVLETEVADLRGELSQLRASLDELRRQLGG